MHFSKFCGVYVPSIVGVNGLDFVERRWGREGGGLGAFIVYTDILFPVVWDFDFHFGLSSCRLQQ